MRDDIKVQEVHTQYSIKNLHGRFVRLDIFATDSSDRKYNFEIQRSDKGAGVKRARYNSSIIDANILDDLRKMRKEWQRCAERLRNCAMKQGMKRSIENAAKLLRQGKLTREEISEVLGIDTETVDKIAESLG